jgi:purine nucleosidase
MTAKRFLIDADPGMGVPYRDIDDGLAILLMIASPEVRVEGITINFGNSKADQGVASAKQLLEAAAVDIPLFKGAASRAELGKSNPAVDFLIETVRDNPGEISLLTLGPLTNAATAMMLDNTFASNLAELIVMGGSLNFKPFSFFGEFNFHRDGKAASTVLSAPVKKALITMDVCSQAVFTKNQLIRFQQNSSQVSRYLSKHIPQWLMINRIVFFRKGGFFPWDVVAAAYAVDNTLFDKNPCTFSVREEGLRSGKIQDLLRHEDFEKKYGTVPINLPLHLESDRFMDLFINRLLEL